MVISKLSAHIDIFPTLAELTGAKIPASVKLDGRSLLPLLKNPSAEWPDRYLFTHVGRWAHMAEPETGKYANCSVRNIQYHLVSVGKETKPNWELYDVKADSGEKNNLAAQNPAVVTQMAAVYEQWWQEVLPCLENEKVQGPKVNPFKELYWKQFPEERPADWDKPKSDLDSAPAGAKSAKKGKKKTEQ
jgi:arylsulfatase